MDDPGSVQGEALEHSLFHELNDEGAQSYFDRMGSHPEDDGLPKPARPGNPRNHLLKILGGEKIGKRGKEGFERRTR